METFQTAEFDTRIGCLRVASSPKGLAYLELPCANGRGFRGWLERHSPGARVVADIEANRAVIDQVRAFLDGERQSFDLPLDLRGTEFQEAVYQDLRTIPYGESRSYADVARNIGRPKAVRPVGAASGSNPVALVVPCHRVISSGGQLHGYAGGRDTKAWLLALESSVPRAGWLF